MSRPTGGGVDMAEPPYYPAKPKIAFSHGRHGRNTDGDKEHGWRLCKEFLRDFSVSSVAKY